MARFGENGQMVFELPAVDGASLTAWCERHLGSPVESELFRTGHLTRVVGARLADGREIVVRVRPAGPRIKACTEVQRRLCESGYPCPEPVAGPAPLASDEATAEIGSTAGQLCQTPAATPSPLPRRWRGSCTWLQGLTRCRR